MGDVALNRATLRRDMRALKRDALDFGENEHPALPRVKRWLEAAYAKVKVLAAAEGDDGGEWTDKLRAVDAQLKYFIEHGTAPAEVMVRVIHTIIGHTNPHDKSITNTDLDCLVVEVGLKDSWNLPAATTVTPRAPVPHSARTPRSSSGDNRVADPLPSIVNDGTRDGVRRGHMGEFKFRRLPQGFVGFSYPSATNLAAMHKELGLRYVISFADHNRQTRERELAPRFRAAGFDEGQHVSEHVGGSFRRKHIKAMDDLIKKLKSGAVQPHQVGGHCRWGVDRTGCMLAYLLHKYSGMPLGEAIIRITKPSKLAEVVAILQERGIDVPDNARQIVCSYGLTRNGGLRLTKYVESMLDLMGHTKL